MNPQISPDLIYQPRIPPTDVLVQLPHLHPNQFRVFKHPARFKVLACGRRWGKTRLGSVMTVLSAMQNKRAWWVAPSYPMATYGWREIRQLALQIPGCVVRDGERLITFPNFSSGWVQIKSADDPDSLRGEGLDLVVVDECSLIRPYAWFEALRPALSDRKGGAVFISTPKGKNWFWHVWTKGCDALELGWKAWTFPTSDNPYMDAAEIQQAKKDLPERIFQQEYLAMFLDDAGGVFRKVSEAACAMEQVYPLPDHLYVIGVDLGRYMDYTVITTLDVTNPDRPVMAAIDRFDQIDYTLQAGRLDAICQKYQPVRLVIEANSPGDPFISLLKETSPFLKKKGLSVIEPFYTTNLSKDHVIRMLAISFENEAIQVLPDVNLINELQAFEMGYSMTGKIIDAAPPGIHDDCVMSLAFARYGADLATKRYAPSAYAGLVPS